MMIIEIDDVSFQYIAQPNDELAVDSISCQIETGTFLVVTGDSGAGKSTFCRLLAGHIPHHYPGNMTGTVTVCGVDTKQTTLGDLASDVGFVFDNPYHQLTGAATTVEEEVAFALENMGVPRDEMKERVYGALEKVGITELRHRNPYQLSGGQCQRVAIASVLAIEPKVLVLKDPTSQLDPKGTEEVLDVIARMNKQGYTVVLSTQDLNRAARYADRIFVFDSGRIKLDGSTEAVLTEAYHRDLPILVPDSVKLGYALRERGLVDESHPIPTTPETAIEDLSRLIGPDRSGEQTISSNVGSTPSSPDEPHNAPLVELDTVDYTYQGDVTALDGVSLRLTEGCVCIMGQNGAGKSTLLKTLNGLLKPTSGDVIVRGNNTKDFTTAQLAADVGLSFQNPDDQLFHSTVEDEIRYGPKNLGYSSSEVDKLVDAVIEQFGLEEIRDENPANLSQPYKKQVAVASVVSMDTPVVVLDEPTGGQDAPGQDTIGAVVDDLVTDGKLVLLVTHDLTFAAEHADRIVLLNKGKLLADGSPRDIFSQSDLLDTTDIQPPIVTQIGSSVGFEGVLSVDELVESVSALVNRTDSASS